MADEISITNIFAPTYKKYVGSDTAIEALGTNEQYMLVQSDNGYIFLIRGESFNLVSNYEVYSGINNPFEYVVVTLKLKRLESQAPELFTEDPDGNEFGELTIHAGQSTLLLKGRACGIYTISKIKVSDETITITAYTHFETIRSKILSDEMSGFTVLQAFDEALTRCGIVKSDIIGNVIENGEWLSSKMDNPNDKITISANTYAWRIIQICAVHLGCKIFFTGSKCYIINYAADGVTNMGTIYLHRDLAEVDETTYTVWDFASTRVSVPSDSSDSVQNTMSVMISNGDTVSISDNNASSDELAPMSLPEYTDTTSALHFCEGAIKYTKTSSKCVSFSLNESVYEVVGGLEQQGFERNILDPSRAEVIKSDYNNTIYTNKNPNGVANSLNLILTSVEMDYPKCNSKYTFGENKVISLDSSLSAIRTAK